MPTNDADYSCHIEVLELVNQSYCLHIILHHAASHSLRGRQTHKHTHTHIHTHTHTQTNFLGKNGFKKSGIHTGLWLALMLGLKTK